jgi:uncharacterized protein (TIGR02246 family)
VSEDERAIHDLIATWLAASKAGDLEKVLSLMADDAIFMVPGQKPFGKEAFAAAFRGMKAIRFEAESEVLEVEVLGDRAWCRTHLAVTATPPNGKPVRRSGYTLSLLRRQPNGAWVVFRDANLLATE